MGKSFPKKKISEKLVYDKDKIRDLYFLSPEYDFSAFCKHAGYKYYAGLQHEFPIRQWRDEKLRMQIEVQDVSIIKDGITLRASILQNRIKSIKRWDENARSWRSVLEHKVRLLSEAAHKDLVREQLIKSGALKLTKEEEANYVPAFNLSESNAMMMTLALEKMHALEQKTLLVPTQDDQKSALGIPTIKESDKVDDGEEERINDMGWHVINGNGLKSHELQNVMSGWFDQLQTTLPAPEAAPEPVEEEEPEKVIHAPIVVEIPPLEEE